MFKIQFPSDNAARFVFAAFAGILLALAFPKFEIAGFAWIAPAILLFASCGARPALAFRIGYIGGFFFYLITLYWLLYIPVKYLPIAGWIALSMYLALYPALWVWLTWKLFPQRAEAPPTGHPATAETVGWFMASSWSGRALWALKAAALWVALEIILGRFLSGFPWEFLGVSQYRMTPLIQISAFTGIYGVSFLIIWFSTALFSTGMAIVHSSSSKNSWAREIALPALALIAVAVSGYNQIRSFQPSSRTVTLALIQPSIPQTLIWDPAESETRFQQLLKLSEAALTNNPDVVVWPEASVPNMVRHHEDTARAVIDLIRRHKVWAIIGSDDAERRPGTSDQKAIDYFNSAFAVSPEGELTGNYRKRRLVIFGEYVPFVKQLPFLRHFSPAGEGGFTPGKGAIPFDLNDLGVLASVLICFEDTFPHHVPDYVTPDTDFLVNLTNNGWFGESAAQWQHAATAVFRAVENRIPLVRCANNGLTCWVDEVGRMYDVFYPGTSDIYGPGFKIVEVPVQAPGEQRQLSFYTRHGDFFGWSCVGLIGINLLAVYLRHTKQRQRHAKSVDQPATP